MHVNPYIFSVLGMLAHIGIQVNEQSTPDSLGSTAQSEQCDVSAISKIPAAFSTKKATGNSEHRQ